MTADGGSLLSKTRRYLSARDDGVAEALFLDEADGVALLDADGVVLRANPRFSSLARASAGDVAWSALPPEAASLLASLRAGRPATVKATSTEAGTRRLLLVSLLPTAGSGGLMRVSDHTHFCDLEDQLAQAHRLQAVGELAGGIAHDFNNLLTAILGASDDLRLRAGGRTDDLRDLSMVRSSAERGAALVRQLLAFSRRQTLQPQVLALNDAVRATTSLLGRLLPNGVRLEVELEEPGRQVRIDPTQLDQVLINLAVNAGHAMPRGGILRVATGHELRLAPETVRGEPIPPGRYARLTVQDSGAGIPADVLPRIFEPFFTTRRESGGTGLGLSTVHGIVRQSGGYMDVHSAPGEGTRFDILLPRHEDPALWRSVPEAAPAAPVRMLAERVLTRAGWRVIAAVSGDDALELVEAGDLAPALACVVSDVVMPGLDGPALVRSLRHLSPGLPAILMSGCADADLRRSLQANDIIYLGKPFAMADLTLAIDALLSEATV